MAAGKTMRACRSASMRIRPLKHEKNTAVINSPQPNSPFHNRHGLPKTRFNKDWYTPRKTTSSASPGMVDRKIQPSRFNLLRAPRKKKTAGTANAIKPAMIDGFSHPGRSLDVTPIAANETPGTTTASRNGQADVSNDSCQLQWSRLKTPARGSSNKIVSSATRPSIKISSRQRRVRECQIAISNTGNVNASVRPNWIATDST